MYAINREPTLRKVTPNVLPCSIKHSGPVQTHKRYWSPTSDKDGKASTAYFRGRKFRGRILKVPKGYQGVVLEKTDKLLPQKPPTADELRQIEEDDEMEVEAEKPAEVRVMDEKAQFDELVVWGHELLPEGDDVYVKGVEEWIAFAEAVGLTQQQWRSVMLMQTTDAYNRCVA